MILYTCLKYRSQHFPLSFFFLAKSFKLGQSVIRQEKNLNSGNEMLCHTHTHTHKRSWYYVIIRMCSCQHSPDTAGYQLTP